MALLTANITLTGAAQALSATHLPVTFVRFDNPTSNADIKVGDNTLTTTNYGFIVEDGPTANKDLGPYGGGTSPINLQHVYVLGTISQVLHITYITL